VQEREEPFRVETKANAEDGSERSKELFGRWQTDRYKAPAASNVRPRAWFSCRGSLALVLQPIVAAPLLQGRVPTNDYGRVDLFHPRMLPGGCVHLQRMWKGRRHG
jgi:hypothetical protein